MLTSLTGMQEPALPVILVVEDEPIIRLMAVDALAELEVKVLEAGDAAEALRALDTHPEVRLLFTDVNMPGLMTGLDLATIVHAARPDIELIVTSGGQTLQNQQLPDHGTFLKKPYRDQQLVDLARKKLATKS